MRIEATVGLGEKSFDDVILMMFNSYLTLLISNIVIQNLTIPRTYPTPCYLFLAKWASLMSE